MRGTWKGLILAGAALLGSAGCWTTDKPPKPSPNPEEFILPPIADARFSQPPTFPDKAMKENLRPRDMEKDDGPPAAFRQGRIGAGGGAY
jgi:hypothetical protein